MRCALGMGHTNTLTAARCLCGTLGGLGRHAEAEALLRSVVATLDDAHTLHTAKRLADTLREQGKGAKAEAVYRPTLAAMRRVRGSPKRSALSTASPFRSANRAGTPRQRCSSDPRWRGCSAPSLGEPGDGV